MRREVRRSYAWFARLDLSSKVALITTLTLALATVVIATAQLALFRKNLKHAIYVEQSSLTRIVAQNLDQQLLLLKNALNSSARAVTKADLVSSDTAQKYLDTNVGLNAIFERSVFLFTPSGRLLAEHPFLPNRRGMDFSWRDYNRDALRTRGPVISRPFVTTKDDHNVVIMLATPVFSKDGKDIIAINSGSFGLTNPSLLGNVAKTVIGKTGFIYIVTKGGLLVMHPDRSLLLQRPYAPGQNPIFDRALAGFEGTGESIERDGRVAVSSFKRIHATDWIVVTVYPEDEAFASFNHLVRSLVVMLVPAVVFFCVLAWHFSHRLVSAIQSKNKLLKRLKSESVRRLKAKSRLFNEASHDFRQRLHGMQLLINATERNHAQRSHPLLRKVKSAIADLQRYLDNFLEVTRLETIEVRPQSSTIVLQDVFHNLELQFEDQLEELHVNLKIRYTAVVLNTDAKMLFRILENLVSNAIKFSRGKVLVAARAGAAGVAIYVLDNGVGIAEEEKKHIFSAFFRAKTCGKPFGVPGFGLGLSIVCRLINILGASIEIRSVPERGTAIKVLFPYARGAE